MNVYMKKMINSRGGATIVEYTIVLPLCLFVVMFLFFAAYFLNERAVLDAAAHRSVLVAQKMYANVQFATITDLNYVDTTDYVGYKRNGVSIKDASEKNEPYRFLTNSVAGVFGGETIESKVKAVVEKKAESCVRNNRLFPMWGDSIGNLTVEVSEPVLDGILVKNITITVSESYEFPKFMQMIGLNGSYTMHGAATTSVSSEPELIRNIDLVIEIIDDVSGGSASDILKKLKTNLKKVGNFVSSLGGE